ncbi:hypothetical protein ACWD3J_41335 [Streptomyces sp. NPDC002755]
MTVLRGPGHAVTALVPSMESHGVIPHVAGVTTADGRTLSADLVVDASGRSTRVPALLADCGVRVISERADAGFRYYTQHFRSPAGSVPPPTSWPVYHHDSLSVVALPGDNDTWSLTLVTSQRDQELRVLGQRDAWRRVAALYPRVGHWMDGEPVDGVLAMGSTATSHRRYVRDGRPVVTGLVPVGDASATSNPQFGLGMTLGFRQAVLLRDSLLAVPLRRPDELALHFAAETEAKISPVLAGLAQWDRERLAEVDASIKGQTHRSTDPQWLFRVALDTARWKDGRILRAMAAVGCGLSTTQEAFGDADLMSRAMELGADAPRYSDPGPTREELLAALDSH